MTEYDADGIMAGLNEALDYVRQRNLIVAMTDGQFREWCRGKHRSTYTKERQWRTDDRHAKKMAAKAKALDLDSQPYEFFTADDFEDDADTHLRRSPVNYERLLQSIASMEAGIRGMQERTPAPRDDGLEPDHPDYFKRYLGASDGLAMMEADGWNFDCPGDDDDATLHDEYLHVLYASSLFEREWQNLINEGWTTITVEAWIDGDHGNIAHVCGAMGAGWRCWTRAGGFEIITHKPDWIMANLDASLKAYVG